MIQDSVNRISYDGNGVATEFAFPFSITATNDVKVMIVDTDGTETILTSDYTVDDVNSKVTYPGYPSGEEPPAEEQPPILADGQRIVIYRELDITQLVSLFNQYPFKAIETMIDKATILLQQINDAQKRALTLSVSTGTDVSLVLPAPSAHKSFRWNADGTSLELTEDPATVLASVQGYTELAEGYATTANEKATLATEAAAQAIDFAEIGVVFGDTYLHPGCVKANGATVNRADYPRLVALANTYSLWTSDTANNLGLFGQGDGSTTMVLPNWTDRMAQFSTTGGGTLAAGLPNVTGAIWGISGEQNGGWIGALKFTLANYGWAASTHPVSNNALRDISFDASWSNSIYGASNTVQPPAIKVIPQMKY